MKKMAAIAAALVFLAAQAQAKAYPPENCNGTEMTTVNLDRFGDNNLSVHPKPGAGPEIDELFPGDDVCAINRVGPWVHIQYVRDGHAFTGWAHSRYLAEIRWR